MLVVVLDALRHDAVPPGWADGGSPERAVRAPACISSAPWTLPSCTSILTGVDAWHHRRYWHRADPPPPPLAAAVPAGYRKVGIVNNSVLRPESFLDRGFDRWHFTRDHDEPFERATRLVRRARRRTPLFLFLHSNIPHDYYLPDAARYCGPGGEDGAGPPCILGERVISWRGVTAEEARAVEATYRASATAALEATRVLLDLARERDDFVTVVTADHGEGLDPAGGRVHHGGRVHDDVVRVPCRFELPSSLGAGPVDQLRRRVGAGAVSSTDLVPTVLDLIGAPLPAGIDGRSLVTAAAGDGGAAGGSGTGGDGGTAGGSGAGRVVVSEDRRYLYLRDRFRINRNRRGKNMSEADVARNEALLGCLGAPPALRSWRDGGSKLVVTSLQRRGGNEENGGNDGNGGNGSEAALLGLAAQLPGQPVLTWHGDRLFALEAFDLVADPGETANLLAGDGPWAPRLGALPWAGAVTVPGADGAEIPLAEVVAAGRTVRVDPSEDPPPAGGDPAAGSGRDPR